MLFNAALLEDEIHAFGADPTPRTAVVRARLPVAGAATMHRCDDGRVLVIVDEAVDDARVERLRRAGEVLVELPA